MGIKVVICLFGASNGRSVQFCVLWLENVSRLDVNKGYEGVFENGSDKCLIDIKVFDDVKEGRDRRYLIIYRLETILLQKVWTK